MSKVTPWEVSGNIDYNKLIKEFGVKKIDNSLYEQLEKKTGPLHRLLRRKIFFAHRDLDIALKNINNLYLYTGCGPSGPIHMGHYIVWEFTKWLQEKLDLTLWFQFTDDEKFLFKDQTFEEIQSWTKENMLDIISVGFDPKKTNFLVDTKHASLMYKEAIKVAKKITFSTVKGAFGFTNDFNVGQIFFTSMQAVPAFLPSVLAKKKLTCLIPHAVDQDPHFRVTRDVINKLGFPKPSSIQCSFFPGLEGSGGKQSSSAGKAIYLTDDPKTVKKKINKYAFSGGKETVEEHRKLGGNPDIDVSFQWLMFLEDDDNKLKKIKEDYKSGKLLTGELKQILIEKLNSILEVHQERRKTAEKQIDKFMFKA